MLPGVGVFGTSLTARVIIPLLKDEGFAVKALWGRTQEEAEELAKEMSVPFSSRPQSLPASESFPMSQLFE